MDSVTEKQSDTDIFLNGTAQNARLSTVIAASRRAF
jgi:hypothetical protein